MKFQHLLALFLMSFFITSCDPNQKEVQKDNNKSEINAVINSQGPKKITRNIIQDRKGNIWMAAFDGIFRYDGKAFVNMTSKVSSARFFSILEDNKGNFWFGSIGSGVYYYDGSTFQNFTTKEGLLNNEVTSIYEDKKGVIWFGVSGGASSYDGNSFRNYIIEGDEMYLDQTGKTFSNRRPYEVTSITENKTGELWFASRGNTYVYNGESFASISHNGKPFKNVRSIIEDKKGNIWLGGADGLWRYNGTTFINFTPNFVGYVYEDKKGNIWTSSEKDNKHWVLSRYNEDSLKDKKPIAAEIIPEDENNKMLFGILEASDESIWFGTFAGVYRYDGNKTKKASKN